MDDLALPPLFDLHVEGETLIIEHLRFRDELDGWWRDELHQIVGHPPEHWALRCDGPADHSELKGPPGPEDDGCTLCRALRIHTKALHRRSGGG